jgi:hypothetical protein
MLCGMLAQGLPARLLATTFYPTHPPRGGVELAYRKDAADPRVLHFPSRATLITLIYPSSSVMLYYGNPVYRVYEYRLQRLLLSPIGGCGRTRTSGRTGKSKRPNTTCVWDFIGFAFGWILPSDGCGLWSLSLTNAKVATVLGSIPESSETLKITNNTLL